MAGNLKWEYGYPAAADRHRSDLLLALPTVQARRLALSHLARP